MPVPARGKAIRVGGEARGRSENPHQTEKMAETPAKNSTAGGAAAPSSTGGTDGNSGNNTTSTTAPSTTGNTGGAVAGIGATGVVIGAPAGGGGIPYYEKQRQHLKELIGRKRALEKKIVSSGFQAAEGHD